MSKIERDETNIARTKRGKREHHNSSAQLERCERLCLSDASGYISGRYNHDQELGLSLQQSSTESSYRHDQRLTIRQNARNNFNLHTDDTQTLSLGNDPYKQLHGDETNQSGIISPNQSESSSQRILPRGRLIGLQSLQSDPTMPQSKIASSSISATMELPNMLQHEERLENSTSHSLQNHSPTRRFVAPLDLGAPNCICKYYGC